MRRILFLLAFGIAIWASSAGWAALRSFRASPTWGGLAVLALYLAVFAVAFLYLGLGLYTAERAAGKVRRPIRFYERILDQADGRRPVPGGRDGRSGRRPSEGGDRMASAGHGPSAAGRSIPRA